MQTRKTAAAIAAAAGLCAVAAAQDSTNIIADAPPFSDAPEAFATNQVIADYVVDLAPLTTSWGNVFGVAPVLKQHNTTQGQFYNNLPGAGSISQTNLIGVSAPAPFYQFWNSAGFGVHPTNNTPATQTLSPAGPTTQFAIAASSFDSGINTQLVAIVNYEPSEPGRLYVRRINAAVNGDQFSSSSQFGGGAVDASGNLYFRVDDFNVTRLPIFNGTGSIHVDSLGRNPSVVSVVSDGSELDSSNIMLDGATTNVLGPAAIPADRAGEPRAMTTNFNDEFISGSPTAFVSRGGSHFGATGVSTQRGSLAYSPITGSNPDSIGTAAILTKSTGGPTDSILVWEIDANGEVISGSSRLLTLPSTISDPVSGHSISGAEIGEFDHVRSLTAFRGANGQVAVGRLPNGRNIAAAVTYNQTGFGTSNQRNPLNNVVAVDWNPNDPSDQNWRLVAWVGPDSVLGTANGGAFNYSGAQIAGADPTLPGAGKAISDGPGGQNLGRLQALGNFANLAGPSISPPYIDAKGNIWFVASSYVDDVDPNGDPFRRGGTRLFRSVWDSASGGYELEQILEVGDIIDGQNSDTQYRVSFIGVADGSTLRSGTLWSNNGNASAWNNTDPADIGQQDTRGTGGVYLPVEITYDSSGTGNFDRNVDQTYQVALYIGHLEEAAPTCPPDLNGDGVVDADDFFLFLQLFADGDPRADFNNDGVIDADDFFAFLAAFAAGC
ncbi:MAG: hypothetical protein JJU33_05510 [Phycisphaerales bacterium]|nr:hypothetical protein [Phycisphaerales bacterium]